MSEGTLAARAAELGRGAGKAAATWVFDANTPDEAYWRVPRSIDDGDPALHDAVPAYAGAFAGSFWTEVERAAREHTS